MRNKDGHDDMASPAPKEKSVEIYNEVLNLPYSEKERIEQYVWRLRTVNKTRPDDPSALLGLLLAHIKLGDAETANNLAEKAWGYKSRFSSAHYWNYLRNLVSLGQFERAVELFETVPATISIDPFSGKVAIPVLWQAYVGLGRLDDAIDVIGRFNETFHESLITFREQLVADGLLEIFPNLMAAQRNAIGERFTEFWIFLEEDEEPSVDFGIWYYVDASRDKRWEMEARIDNAMAEVCQRNGRPRTAFVPKFTVLVQDIATHWEHTVLGA